MGVSQSKELTDKLSIASARPGQWIGSRFWPDEKGRFIRRRTENERRAEKTNTASGTKNTAVLLPRCARFEILS